MAILVTGATGFLGKRVVEKLSAQGRDVVANGRNKKRGHALSQLDGVRFVAADLQDKESAAHLLKDIDAIVHCAGKASPWGSHQEFFSANVEATRSLLAESLKRSVDRFVYISTSSVYARNRSQYGVQEDAVLTAPANEYVASKIAAEKLVRAAPIPSVILRPRGLFGPGDTNVLPRLLQALSTGKLPIIGSGHTRADLTYVDNAADATIDALNASGQALGKTYNITNGQSILIWQQIAELARTLSLPIPTKRIPFAAAYTLAAAMETAALFRKGRPEPKLTRYTVGLVGLTTTLDISRAKRELQYTPRIDMAAGIASFVDWWKAQKHAY